MCARHWADARGLSSPTSRDLRQGEVAARDCGNVGLPRTRPKDFVRFERCGHDVLTEQPDKVADVP